MTHDNINTNGSGSGLRSILKQPSQLSQRTPDSSLPMQHDISDLSDTNKDMNGTNNGCAIPDKSDTKVTFLSVPDNESSSSKRGSKRVARVQRARKVNNALDPQCLDLSQPHPDIVEEEEVVEAKTEALSSDGVLNGDSDQCSNQRQIEGMGILNGNEKNFDSEVTVNDSKEAPIVSGQSVQNQGE